MTRLSYDFMWFIGMFEGEGSIVLRKPNADVKKHSVVISIVSTDLDVINKVYKVIGHGSVTGPYDRGNPKWKVSYRWGMNSASEIDTLLKSMLPYLGERRKFRAIEAIEYLKLNRAIRGYPVCPAGHLYTPENTYHMLNKKK